MTAVPLGHGALDLELPGGWAPAEAPAGVALLALGPHDPGAVHPSLVLTVDDVTGLAGLRDWQQGADYLMAAQLGDYLLLDLERLPVAGAEGVRRLAHHVVDGARSVTLEQWAFVHDGLGVTLSATVGTFDYPALASSLRRTAASLAVRAP